MMYDRDEVEVDLAQAMSDSNNSSKILTKVCWKNYKFELLLGILLQTKFLEYLFELIYANGGEY